MKAINNLKINLKKKNNTEFLQKQNSDNLNINAMFLQKQNSDDFWSQYPQNLSYNRLPLLANVIYDSDYKGEYIRPQHNNTKPHTIFLPHDIFFVKTELLTNINLNSINVPIILVSGVSDASPSYDVYIQIITNSNIKKWIGANIPYSHPKIVKVLIGAGEPERVYGNHNDLIALHTNRIKYEQKIHEVCIPYHSQTHSSRSELKSTIPRLEFKEYMKEISKYKFVYCKRGAGIDTHRFSEILLMGSVPIIEHSGLDDLYCRFPCMFVEDNIDNFVWDETKYQNFLDMFWLRDGFRKYLNCGI
jgi:hypothetical protein